MTVMAIGDVAQIVMGQAPPGATTNKHGEGVPLVKAGEFRRDYPVVHEWTTRPLRLAEPGDTLVSVVGSIGKVNRGIDCAIGRSVAAIRPDQDRVDAKFLFRALQSAAPALVHQAQGVAQGVITREMVGAVKLAFPPLPEQRRIAAILDHADGLRAKRRQVLSQLEALSQSIFRETFAGRYPTKRLDELTDPDDRVNYGVVQPGDDTTGGVPLIRISNLAGGIVDRSNLKKISPEVEAAYARSRLRGSEILVSCVGSIGAVSVVRPPDVGSNIARAITRVPISDEVLRTYVAAYLRTPTPQRYFVAELRTVAQPTLNVSQLAATQIPLPPVALQLAFRARLRLAQDNAAAVMATCDADDELFASLQFRAFRGEL